MTKRQIKQLLAALVLFIGLILWSASSTIELEFPLVILPLLK